MSVYAKDTGQSLDHDWQKVLVSVQKEFKIQ